MTAELVLLLSIFGAILLGVLAKTPMDSFYEAGPKLGARIESQITIGQQFKYKGQPIPWKKSE